jgi:hypothetical protein
MWAFSSSCCQALRHSLSKKEKRIREVILFLRVGLTMEFRSEKIPRNRLGTVSDIPWKKGLIPRSTEESIPKLEAERKYEENISFKKQPK